MAPRKGKGRQAVRNHSGGFPGWGYAVIGVIIGAILMAMVMRGSLFSNMRKDDGPKANPHATAKRGGDSDELGPAHTHSAPKKPKFDFYSVLSEKEVRIPDAEISAQARIEQQRKQQAAEAQQATTPPDASQALKQDVTAAPASAVPQPAKGSGYLLQVGAFPNAADAETLKAKLALQGFVANVQSVNVGGQTYHRVRLGPFHSATRLESIKQRLTKAGINSIALKEGS